MFLYTKKGAYHRETQEVSGDVVRGVDDGNIAVLAIADGVSACAYGAEGAGLVSALALDLIREQYTRLHFFPEGWACRMVQTVREQLSLFAQENDASCEEFSSTLMTLLIDRERERFYYCNIGDGLLLTIGDSGCPIVSMPQGDADGCPVVTTKGVERIIETGSAGLSGIDNILMCTDGTWRTMYQRNRLCPQVREHLVTGNFDQFERYIEASNPMDDCSFAVVNIRRPV